MGMANGIFMRVHNGQLNPLGELKGKKIKWLWSVLREDDVRQFGPIHNQNAFLEDRMHDWNIKGDHLHFFSRIHERGAEALIYIELE